MVLQLFDWYVYTLVDSSFESDSESVESGFPAHNPSGSAFAGWVKRPDSEVDAFERAGLIGREMTTGPDRVTDPGVETFDSDRWARDPTDFRVELQNGTNSGNADFHMRMIAGYFLAHVSVNSTKRSRAAGSVGPK